MSFSQSHRGHELTLEIPVIETERLVLRAPSEADFEAEAAFYQTDRADGVGGKSPRDQVWRSIAGMIGHWAIRGYGFWGVDEKATGRYCGHVGLWFPEGWPEPEIGWTLMGHAEGRGIAYEAAVAARTHAYEMLGWPTAISLILGDNHRSAALAQRLGATLERDYEHPSYGQMNIWRHPSRQAVLGKGEQG